MKRQRNTTQIKEQARNTEIQINVEEIGKLTEKGFRIIIVKIIKNHSVCMVFDNLYYYYSESFFS